MPVVVYVLGASLFGSLYRAPHLGWNAARLAPAIGWVRGHALYSTEQAGSVQTTMYSPFSAIAYAPAALFDEPTSAVVAGSILAHLYYFLPVLYLALSEPGRRSLGFLLFFFFAVVTFNFEGPSESIRIHADAPALGLGLTSCIVLLRCRGDLSHRNMLMTAVAAWLAVWSKQPLLPLVPTLCLWVFATRGRRQGIGFALWMASAGVATAGLLFMMFPLDGLLFNTVRVPAQVPWLGNFPYNLAFTFLELQEYLLPVALTLLGCTILLLRQDPVDHLSQWLLRNPWSLLLLASLVLVPVSVLARVKIGGALNNFSYTLHLALAAVIAVSLRLSHLWDTHEEKSALHSYTKLIALSGLLVAVWAFQSTVSRKLHLFPEERNENRIAYDYVRDHPGSGVYFPGQPLAHLLAEKSLPHFSLAVYDRDTLTPYRVGMKQIAAHLPTNLSQVCIGHDFKKESDRMVRTHLPEFAKTPVQTVGDPFECVGKVD